MVMAISLDIRYIFFYYFCIFSKNRTYINKIIAAGYGSVALHWVLNTYEVDKMKETSLSRAAVIAATGLLIIASLGY